MRKAAKADCTYQLKYNNDLQRRISEMAKHKIFFRCADAEQVCVESWSVYSEEHFSFYRMLILEQNKTSYNPNSTEIKLFSKAHGPK